MTGAVVTAAGSAASVNAAINQIASMGGGTVFVSQNVPLEASIVMQSNVKLLCASTGITLKLNNNVNADVLVGQGAYTLFGTATVGGVLNASIENCKFDGNSANQSLPATCPDGVVDPLGSDHSTAYCVNGIAIYGNALVFRNVTVQNVLGAFFRTDGRVQGNTTPNTVRYEHVLGQNAGLHGINCNGPSDGSYSDVVIVDAGQRQNNTYSGVETGGVCTGDWTYYHGYHSGGAVNRVKYQFEHNVSNAGTITHVLSNFEGGMQEMHVAAGAVICSSCMWYAPFQTSVTGCIGNTAPCALVDLDTSGNILQGKWIGVTGQSNFAVAIGPGGNIQCCNILTGVFNNFDKVTPFNFVHDVGTTIVGRGIATGGSGATTFGGTVSASSIVDYQQGPTGGTVFNSFWRGGLATGSGGQPVCVSTSTGAMYRGTAGAC